jgi:hypothetical protein
MGQEGIATIKEQTKGVETILAVDHAHEALKNFQLRPGDNIKEEEKESPQTITAPLSQQNLAKLEPIDMQVCTRADSKKVFVTLFLNRFSILY